MCGIVTSLCALPTLGCCAWSAGEISPTLSLSLFSGALPTSSCVTHEHKQAHPLLAKELSVLIEAARQVEEGARGFFKKEESKQVLFSLLSHFAGANEWSCNEFSSPSSFSPFLSFLYVCLYNSSSMVPLSCLLPL